MGPIAQRGEVPFQGAGYYRGPSRLVNPGVSSTNMSYDDLTGGPHFVPNTSTFGYAGLTAPNGNIVFGADVTSDVLGGNGFEIKTPGPWSVWIGAAFLHTDSMILEPIPAGIVRVIIAVNSVNVIEFESEISSGGPVPTFVLEESAVLDLYEYTTTVAETVFLPNAPAGAWRMYLEAPPDVRCVQQAMYMWMDPSGDR